MDAPPSPSDPARESVDQALARLGKLHPKIIDLSLGRIERLLARLGNPHVKGPPVIHVAGTNGKGSVIAFMRALLEASGHTVHVYTSPHLVRFAERIRISGALIDEAVLAEILRHVEHLNGEEPITFFEVTTAAAFTAFSHVPADVVLLETGLGGRLDATNVVPKPLAAVITPIGYDHQSYLGETLAEIAGEKAAILKPDVPGVIAQQRPEAAEVIQSYAKEVGVELAIEGDRFEGAVAHGKFRFRNAELELDGPAPNLDGAHQASNAAVAVQALHAAGFPLPAFALRSAMRRVVWPARLQQIADGPLASALPPGCRLWLDGGHNESAGQILKDWVAAQPGETVLICGMMAAKDPRAFLSALRPQAARLVAVPIPGQANALPPAELAAAAQEVGFEAETAISVAQAIRAVSASGAQQLLICGSLYLAGEVLAQSGLEPD